MTVIVAFDPNCLFDFYPRTADNRALVKQYVKDLRKRLAEHEGVLEGSRQVSDAQPKRYIWEDANWRVGYSVEQTGNRFFGRKMQVVIRAIELKQVSSD